MKKYVLLDDVIQQIEAVPFTMSVCMTVEECKAARRAQEIIASIVKEAVPPSDVVERCEAEFYKALADSWEDQAREYRRRFLTLSEKVKTFIERRSE